MGLDFGPGGPLYFAWAGDESDTVMHYIPSATASDLRPGQHVPLGDRRLPEPVERARGRRSWPAAKRHEAVATSWRPPTSWPRGRGRDSRSGTTCAPRSRRARAHDLLDEAAERLVGPWSRRRPVPADPVGAASTPAALPRAVPARVGMPVDPQVFKQAMSQFASGVTVVTTVHEGKRFGLTASSFSSLSLDPPLVLVCLARKTTAHGIIEKSGVFAVNVLAAQQLEFGMRFAGLRAGSRGPFPGHRDHVRGHGSPLLPGVMSWVDCKLWSRYDGRRPLDLRGRGGRPRGHRRGHAAALPQPALAPQRGPGGADPSRARRAHGGRPRGRGAPASALRARLVDALVEAGVARLQVALLPARRRGPAPRRCRRRDGLWWSALAADERGVERAAAAGLTQVDLGVAASEATSRKATGRSPEAGDRRPRGARAARRAPPGLAVRVGILCAFASPDEGDVPPAARWSTSRGGSLDAPLDELALVDSAGAGAPAAGASTSSRRWRRSWARIPLVAAPARHAGDGPGQRALRAQVRGRPLRHRPRRARGIAVPRRGQRERGHGERGAHAARDGDPSGIDRARLEECSDLVERAGGRLAEKRVVGGGGTAILPVPIGEAVGAGRIRKEAS